MVDVDDTGRIAVSYYDFRNDENGDDELSTDFWVAYSHDGGLSFPTDDRLTADSFDMRTARRAGLFRRRLHRPVAFRDRFDSLWVAATATLANRNDAFHQSAG